MPDITLPRSFVAGTIVDADPVMENLHDPTAVPETFDVINGRLDSANVDAGVSFTSEHVQRGAFARGRGVGATANLDFFGDWFFQLSPLATADTNNAFVAIPGAAQSVFLPWAPTVFVAMWQAMWNCNADDGPGAIPVEQAAIKLFVDGTAVGYTRRLAPRSMTVPATRTGFIDDRTRWYSGHYTSTTMTQGWHNLALRIAHDIEVTEGNDGQARVYTRSFKWLAFR